MEQPQQRWTLENLDRSVRSRWERLVDLRREFHRHPELAFREHRTASRVAELLSDAGLDVRKGVGGTGVVALVRGSKPGKTLLVRADMDALPIQEQNLVPYRSEHPGVMHACGHDGHTAVALVTAEVLAQVRDQLAGNVKFVFQPAEETVGGAKRMIEDGVLEDPRPDAAISFHLLNTIPVGKVGLRSGPLMANADEFEIIIKGKGTHGAMPHLGVDPVVISAQVVLGLQTLVSREVPPLVPAVLTVGTINGGSAFNIVPEEVRITGTVRTFDADTQRLLRERMDELLRGLTGGTRSGYSFTYTTGCPAVVNDPSITEFVRKVAIQVVGEANVVTPELTMGGDDMSLFLQQVPGTYFQVGSANPEKGLDNPHHSAIFDFDEEALTVAARILVRACAEYLA